jgi:hypothetical protein
MPDSYALYLSALRAWIGRRGLSSLAWFYGTRDARNARVAYVVTLPQLALLHYLIRSNGAIKVIETAQGEESQRHARLPAGAPVWGTGGDFRSRRLGGR